MMVGILDPKGGESSYDPACGAGGMLLAAVDYVERGGGDPRTFFGKIYGQEKKLTTSSVARMNLVLHGIEDFKIVREVRFDGWQATHAGERAVKMALRKTLFQYELHQDQDLFDRAYGYIAESY